MSRALGAAFLSHQVEQLEKTVGRESRSTASNNWRERNGQSAGGRGGKRGGAPHPQGHHAGRKKERKDGREGKEAGKFREQSEAHGSVELDKDADVVVVDASVLVHALGQLKKWCKEGRQEVILIPLEGDYNSVRFTHLLNSHCLVSALNTLDLLKKGSSPLAQQARAASRILESQVGTNPRIRVQRDDAFVLWDEIPFMIPSSDEPPVDGSTPTGSGLAPPPEWLRRTICCGRWEMMNAALDSLSNAIPASLTLPESRPSRSSTPTSSVDPPSHPPATTKPRIDDNGSDNNPEFEVKVVLAIVATGTATSPGAGSSLDTSTAHPGRFERADGSLVRIWAQRAGIQVLDVDPAVRSSGHLSPHHPPSSLERRRSHTQGNDRRVLRESKDVGTGREGERRPSLVEKPIAMAIVNEQPVKVLRVLARGEKLEP